MSTTFLNSKLFYIDCISYEFRGENVFISILSNKGVTIFLIIISPEKTEESTY